MSRAYEDGPKRDLTSRLFWSKRPWATSVLALGIIVSFQTVSADELSDNYRALKLGLPAIESLSAESDYTAFLAPNVPVEIRRAALRKLWSLPVFSQTDSLDNYTGNYSAKADDDKQAHADFRLVLD